MKDYIKKIFKYKSTLALLLISLLSIAMTLGRFFVTGQKFFAFMFWNLFLAFIPWFAASIIYTKDLKSKFLTILITIFWLGFFPNSPYLLTDLIHLGKDKTMPVWYDLIMLLSYGLAGLIYGFVSLQMIEEKMKTVFKIKHTNLLSVVLIYISCFGIYLGRFLRWNTWDLITNLGEVMGDVVQRMTNPTEHRTTWVYTFLLGTLLNIVYITFKQDDLKLTKD